MTKEQKRAAGNLRDSELIKRHLQGDTRAFTKLVELHRKDLVLFNYKIIHDYKEAEDAVQEEFLIFLKALNSGKYKENRTFGGWVRKTARNYLSHKYRKHTLITEHPEELPEIVIDLQNDENDDETGEIKKIVFGVMEELPERDVKLLILRYWKKLSWKKIGKRFKMDENTVSGYHSRIIKKIKKLFAKNIFQKKQRILNF